MSQASVFALILAVLVICWFCGTDQITRLFISLVTLTVLGFLICTCVWRGAGKREVKSCETPTLRKQRRPAKHCLCCFFKVSFGSRKQKNELYADCTLPASVLLFVVLVTVLHLHLTLPCWSLHASYTLPLITDAAQPEAFVCMWDSIHSKQTRPQLSSLCCLPNDLHCNTRLDFRGSLPGRSTTVITRELFFMCNIQVFKFCCSGRLKIILMCSKIQNYTLFIWFNFRNFGYYDFAFRLYCPIRYTLFKMTCISHLGS